MNVMLFLCWIHRLLTCERSRCAISKYYCEYCCVYSCVAFTTTAYTTAKPLYTSVYKDRLRPPTLATPCISRNALFLTVFFVCFIEQWFLNYGTHTTGGTRCAIK